MTEWNKLTAFLSSYTSAVTEKIKSNRLRPNQAMRLTKKFPIVLEENQKNHQKSISKRYQHLSSQKNQARYSVGKLETSVVKKKENIIMNSRSLSLKKHPLNEASRQNNEQEKHHRQSQNLLLLREEKLSKLKVAYHLKSSKTNTDTKKKVYTSISDSKDKIKFNSFKGISGSYSIKKEKYPNPFEKLLKKNESGKELPKFLQFCEERQDKDGKESIISNNLPKSLRENNRQIQVKSMKQLNLIPLVEPITLEHNRKIEDISHKIDIQWLKKSYQPKLDLLKNIDQLNFQVKTYQEGVYLGQIIKNTQIKDGLGIIFYKNSKVYQGQFLNDKKEGLGYEHYPDNSFYEGNFHNGKKQGRGIFSWNNGEVYDGEWKQNKKEGSGIWKGLDSLSYVGEWRSDIIEGFGVLIDKEQRYQGEFRNFMKYGNGTFRFSNGETYTGTFKQNLPNGLGDYYWNNGDQYHGEFMNGKRHGKGSLKFHAGGSYSGQFKNDKKSGYGEEIYQDNLFYVGNFENDFRHGFGTLYCDNYIPIYQGYWLNNEAASRANQIETIIEEDPSNREPSKLDQITSQKSRKHQNFLLRNKIMMKKLQKIRKEEKSLSKSSEKKHEIKPFRRACECPRHKNMN